MGFLQRLKSMNPVRILKALDAIQTMGQQPKDDGHYDSGGTTGPFRELKDNPDGYYKAYREVVWLRRTIDLRAANCASIPLRLYRVNPKNSGTKMAKRRLIKKMIVASRQGETLIEKNIMEQLIPIDSHPILDLLSDVNPYTMNRSDLWRDTEKNLGIYGEAFWYLEGLSTKQPREIYMLPNKRVEVIPGDTPQEFIKHYKYQANSGRDPILYPPGNIIHFRYSDPDCPYQGLSPQSSTMGHVNSYRAANRWNYVFFKNAVKPSGFVQLPAGEDVTDDDIQMIREAIQAVHGGIENQAKVGVFTHGAEWVDLFSAYKDADWKELQSTNREVFCASQGTPLFLVSSHDATHFATAKQAEESFWTDTIIPELRWFEEVLFWNLIPLFEESFDMVLRFDLTEVPALEKINASKSERVQQATGVPTKTPNEGRKMLGDAPFGSDGDKLYGPLNMGPLFEQDSPEEVQKSDHFECNHDED